MNILEQIIGERRAAVKEAKKRVSLNSLAAQAKGRAHHSLSDSLRAKKGRPAIIAEIKKASLSAGLLKPDFDAGAIAALYAKAGASAISVLTEPKHFLGSEGDLRAARKAVSLPVLRKDFICDSYQLYEAAAWGADAVLLIVAALDSSLLKDLYLESRRLGLDVLVESHTSSELEAALELKDAMIGINSRDLKTLKTDLNSAADLARQIPAGRLAVAESGIRTRADIENLLSLGYSAFLVGEALMLSPRPEELLRNLTLVKIAGKP